MSTRKRHGPSRSKRTGKAEGKRVQAGVDTGEDMERNGGTGTPADDTAGAASVAQEPAVHRSPDAIASADLPDAGDNEDTDDIAYRKELEALWKAHCKELFGEDNWFCREHRLEQERYRAKQAAFKADDQLRDQHRDDLAFQTWNPNRALDIQDFEYLHLHRHHFDEQVREHLEIVAAKINRVSDDGRDGYFNKLERNIGWTPHIVPLLFTELPVVDKLVRCGLWSNAQNSRRCHKPDLCPLCLWNDFLKVQVTAFGEASGAFYRAATWMFFTLSFTTSKANSKAVFKTLEKEDYAVFHDGFRRDGLRGGYYDPAPVRLGDDTGDQSHLGMTEARILLTICQQAAESLYPEILSGYKIKHEGMFRIFADGVRCLPHQHGIGNSRIDTDGKSIAQRFYDAMQAGLDKHRHLLSRDYFPDVHVFQIPDPVALEKCIVYTEKVVPIGLIVAEALDRPEAKMPDGTWNHRYVKKLITQLTGFVEDLTENLYHGFKHYDVEKNLRRRKTVGNLVFSDKGTCIGDEPGWHVKLRRKKAKALREARERKKQREQELLEAEQGKSPASIEKNEPAPQRTSKPPQSPSGQPGGNRGPDGRVRPGKAVQPKPPAPASDSSEADAAVEHQDEIHPAVRPANDSDSLAVPMMKYTYSEPEPGLRIKPNDKREQERPNAGRTGFS